MLYLTELLPIKTNQKSFYKKAIVEHTENTQTLLSYGTHIATISDNKIIYLNKNIEVYTQTTLKHLKEFFYQTLGLKGLTKKDILKLKENLQGVKA